MQTRSLLLAICALAMVTNFAAPELRCALIFACACLLPLAGDPAANDPDFARWHRITNGLIMFCLAAICCETMTELLLWSGAFAVSSLLSWLSSDTGNHRRCRAMQLTHDTDEKRVRTLPTKRRAG